MAAPRVTTRVLRRLLASGLTARAERLLTRAHPADLAPLFGDLSHEEIRSVVDLLYKHRRAAETLMALPPELLPEIFEALGDRRLAEVIARLEVDDMVEAVEWLPEERRDAVVALLPDREREALRKAELYAPSSAGRVMTTRFLALDEKMTAQEAIDSIRAAGDDTEAVLYLYVVDDQRRLQGVVPIRRLVSSPPERTCGELMIPDPHSVLANADQEEAAKLVARYDLLAVPVTDDEGRIVGVITVDDVIDVIYEEATEDMYHLAGLHEGDRVFSSPFQSLRRRMPWMLVNLATAFLAASVVGLFQGTLEQIVALAFFMPVVAGMGGNSGIQALTVITRGIALGEIEFSTGIRAVMKEMSVALMIGVATGLLSAAAAYLWIGKPYLGLVLFLAMVLTLTVAGLMGAIVPLVLKALGQDPALGSGVIVTTFTDVFGFFCFLGIATLLIDRLS